MIKAYFIQALIGAGLTCLEIFCKAKQNEMEAVEKAYCKPKPCRGGEPKTDASHTTLSHSPDSSKPHDPPDNPTAVRQRIFAATTTTYHCWNAVREPRE
jgi:hypothetical protein